MARNAVKERKLIGNKIDLTGQKFGDFKVLFFDNTRDKYQYYWMCQCINCDKIKSISAAALRSGKISRCECNLNYGKSEIIKGYKDDLSGKKFGRFKVLNFSHKSNSHSFWVCECECGNIETHSITYINKSKFQMCKECLIKYKSMDIDKNKVKKEKIPFNNIQYQRKNNKIEILDEYAVFNDDILVDLEDVETIISINRYIAKNTSNYAYFNWKNREYFLHRFLMGLPQSYNTKSQAIVDHINGNSLDNRKSNLRICKKEKNPINCKTYSNNTSGRKGVSYNKKLHKYQVNIQYNKKNYYLGVFSDINDAIKVRKDAEENLFGEFNRQQEFLLGGNLNG